MLKFRNRRQGEEDWKVCKAHGRLATGFNFKIYEYKINDIIYSEYNYKWIDAFKKEQFWTKLNA